jgi:hypothetical protein
MDSTLRCHVRSEASAAAARAVAARAAAERAAATREVAAREASADAAAAREATSLAAAALEAAAREAAVLATAARSAVAAARAAAIRWSVQRGRQRPYSRPSRQRGARLRAPSDDEEEKDGLDGDAAKKEEHDDPAKEGDETPFGASSQ